MQAWEYRDGDIVEVSPGRLTPPFKGVVDSRLGRSIRKRSPTKWVYVRQLEPVIATWSGGWYANTCRLIIRPPKRPTPFVPENIILGED